MNGQNLVISSDKQKLDLDFVHHFITNTYWAKGRSIDDVKTCVNNSLNFGVYLNNRQIGYARVVTDKAVFAYVMDVFIDEHFRGKGFARALVSYILNCEELRRIRTWKLATTDAHGLYEKFGFKSLAHPERMMERVI